MRIQGRGEIPRRGLLATMAAIAALALALNACSGTPPEAASEALTANRDGTTVPPRGPLEPDDPPRKGGKLVVGVSSDVNGWNPNINQWTDGGSTMGSSMVEPLVTLNSDGDAEPLLAESWDHSADYRAWTITVRDGIRFHNGQVLDAKALKRNFEARIQTGLSRVGLGQLYDRVEVTGPRTVTVHLKVEWAQYPASLATVYIMAPAMFDREDQGVTSPIGTGPFRYVDWQLNKHLKVIKNADYWRKDRNGGSLPHLDEIEFRTGLTEDARREDLVAGDVDMIVTSDARTARDLEQEHTVLRDYNTERTLILLNTAEGKENKGNPFTNVHARRAIARATDNQAIARHVGEGVQVTTQAYRVGSRWALPPGDTGYHHYDKAAALREIEEYKRETGKPKLAFTLKTMTEPKQVAMMQKVVAQWKEVGIEATMDSIDQVPFSIVVPLGTYQAAYYRGYGNSNPDSNYTFHAAENVNPVGELSINFTHYTTPTLQKNLATQRENTDFGVRKAANSAVVREINDQALNIWLYDTPWSIVTQKRVRGLNNFRTHPFANFSSKPWWGEVWLSS